MVAIQSEIELRTCRIYLDDNGFCVIDVKPLDSGIITMLDAVAVCEADYEICEQKRTPLLFDMSVFVGGMEQGLREVFRHNEKLSKIKCNSAIILNSLGNRIFVNFYIKFNKPETPFKMLSKKQDAVDFLLERACV